MRAYKHFMGHDLKSKAWDANEVHGISWGRYNFKLAKPQVQLALEAPLVRRHWY